MYTKRLILIGLAVGLSIPTWWTTHRWLSVVGEFSNWTLYSLPLFFGIVYAAMIGIALALLKSRLDRIAIITASWATFILFFPVSVWYLSVLPIFFWLWMEASRQSHNEINERHKLRTKSIIGSGSKLILLGIFLMISLGFYSLRVGGVISLDSVSQGAVQRINNVYDSPIVQNRLNELPVGTGGVRQQVTRSVDTFVRRWLEPLVPFFPPLLAFALFLGLWSSAGLLRWPVIWVASGILALMRHIGFISITEKQVPKEVISL